MNYYTYLHKNKIFSDIDKTSGGGWLTDSEKNEARSDVYPERRLNRD